MASILVVDDDEMVRTTVARVLRSTNHTVRVADSVAAARRVLSERDVDLVICDMNMPDEMGIALLEEVHDQLPDTAVFMLTGVDDPEIAERALDLGATGYVVKPFLPNEILINVTNGLRLRDLERQRRAQFDELEVKLVDRTRALRSALKHLNESNELARVSEHEVVERLTAALAMRDEETGAHIQRMGRYAAVLARERGIDVWPHEVVQVAAMLHDVGKIGVPDGILLKAGPLTEGEFAVIRRHPDLGYRLLADSDSDVLRLGATVALTHHERWDGSGYPSGMAADAIPIEGRLAAVADVFDALTSNRVYRRAMSVEQAMGIMREGRATHFDPDILDSFEVVVDELLVIRENHPDEEEDAPISVLVVDDHEMFAESLARLLGREQGIVLVGTAGTAATAIDLARRHRPDVVLMDWTLPDADGLTATRSIREEVPETKVVLLTGRTDEAAWIDALRAGCVGFLSKHQAVDRLAPAIRAAHAGESVLPPGAVTAFLSRGPTDPRQSNSTLTPREVEVLDLLARGMSVDAIAGRLVVSVHTVRNHVRSLMAKLDVHTRLEAVTAAVRQGIIQLP
jgi:putative two-component system response regulator